MGATSSSEGDSTTPTSRNPEEQQLYSAARGGDQSSLQALLASSAAPIDLGSKHNIGRETALHGAAGQGHAGCVSDLIKAGASVDATQKRGWTPLHEAVWNCPEGSMWPLLQLLAHQGAAADDYPPQLTATLKGHETCASLLLAAGANLEAAGKAGFTPLHIAVGRGHVSCVSLLLKAGANVHTADKGGWTALHAVHRAPWNSVACMSLLLEAGAKLDAADKNGHTPLYSAAQQGYVACVSLLLKAGAKLGAAASDGSTPLSVAHGCGRVSTVAVLQGESRWRRRRALALIREQREAGSDWKKARKMWKHQCAH